MKIWKKFLMAVVLILLIAFLGYCLVAVAKGMNLSELWQSIFQSASESSEEIVETTAKILMK